MIFENSVVRFDHALDGLIEPGAELAIVHTSNGFFEGPLWIDRDGGFLAFSDIHNNRIGRLEQDGSVSFIATHVFDGDYAAEGNIFKAHDRYLLLIGPNGLARDLQGRIVYCGFSGSHQVIRLEHDGTKTVIADRFDGKLLMTPNDLVVKSDGAIYFTDSDSRSEVVKAADAARPDDHPRKSVGHPGVYRIAGGTLELLTKEIARPNGLAFSPDERLLYVADTPSKLVRVLDVRPEGTLANERIFADMSASRADGIADGLKVDRYGNLFTTGPGGVWIFSPEGRHLGTIETPEHLTNLAFGGVHGSTLYITSPSYIFRIETLTADARPSALAASRQR